MGYCHTGRVMRSKAITLRLATDADVNPLAAVMARAFFDDPPLVWLLPDPATRLSRVTRVFATIIGIESLRHGGVDVACADGEILGGAIWMAPGHRQPCVREQVRALPRYAQALGWLIPGRGARLSRAFSTARPKEPHWYLKAIGVDPAWQGHGVAGLLLRSRLKRCDQAGQPAYLEASKPTGIPMYQHFGFRRTMNLAMPEGAPVITAMWRKPAAPSAT
jgi:GNAT superfamily N-acetyltransferase